MGSALCYVNVNLEKDLGGGSFLIIDYINNNQLYIDKATYMLQFRCVHSKISNILLYESKNTPIRYSIIRERLSKISSSNPPYISVLA